MSVTISGTDACEAAWRSTSRSAADSYTTINLSVTKSSLTQPPNAIHAVRMQSNGRIDIPRTETPPALASFMSLGSIPVQRNLKLGKNAHFLIDGTRMDFRPKRLRVAMAPRIARSVRPPLIRSGMAVRHRIETLETPHTRA